MRVKTKGGEQMMIRSRYVPKAIQQIGFQNDFCENRIDRDCAFLFCSICSICSIRSHEKKTVQICSVHSSSDSTSEVHDVRYQLLQLLQQIVSGAIFVAIDVQATAFALVLFLSGQIALTPLKPEILVVETLSQIFFSFFLSFGDVCLFDNSNISRIINLTIQTRTTILQNECSYRNAVKKYQHFLYPVNHLNQRKSPSAPLVSKEKENRSLIVVVVVFFLKSRKVPKVADPSIVAGGGSFVAQVS